MLKRAILILICALFVALPSGAAYAGGSGGLGCSDSGAAGCRVTAGTPGDQAHGGRTGQGSSGGSGSGSSAGGATNGVRCVPAAGGPPVCLANMAGQGGPGGGTPVPLPVVAAQLGAQAAANLRLPKLGIVTSPPVAARQLVSVPTWMWVTTASWSSQSATAAVPGFSVTAVATPQVARWGMGDGVAVTCRGPGTPWRGRGPILADHRLRAGTRIYTPRTPPLVELLLRPRQSRGA